MSHVSLGVSRNNANGGSFLANAYIDGKPTKTKTASVGVGYEIAYETVDLWAEDISKELGIQYNKCTLKELTAKLEGEVIVKKPKEPYIYKSVLGNKLYFKGEIKKAFAAHSADLIRATMKEGLKLLNELERERIKVEKNSGKAKTDMAKAMYQTFVDTGVDTSIYCNDDSIVSQFKKLQLNPVLI